MKDNWVPFAAMVFCIVGCAVNIAFYVAVGNPLSLGAAVFTGALAVFNGALAVRS